MSQRPEYRSKFGINVIRLEFPSFVDYVNVADFVEYYIPIFRIIKGLSPISSIILYINRKDYKELMDEFIRCHSLDHIKLNGFEFTDEEGTWEIN